MDFVINNPFPQQMYQNQGFSFPDYDSKKLTLFFSASGSDQGIKQSTGHNIFIESNIITEEGPYIDATYSASGEVSTEGGNASSSSYVTATYSGTGNFTFILVEPLIVDKMSDVFLDNFTIYNPSASMTNASSGQNTYGVVLKIDSIQQNIISNNTTINAGELIILNSNNQNNGTTPFFYESKNKKFNYLGVMQPGRYRQITGRLTDVNNAYITRAENTNNPLSFSIELVISTKK